MSVSADSRPVCLRFRIRRVDALAVEIIPVPRAALRDTPVWSSEDVGEQRVSAGELIDLIAHSHALSLRMP